MTAATAPLQGLTALGEAPRLRDYLAGLWSRRQLAFALASGELRRQHADTVLGSLWQLVNPILLIAVYYLVFGVLLGNVGANGPDWRPDNYIGFLAVGVFVYSVLQRSVSAGASSISNNIGLIRSLPFPRALLPLSAVLREALGFLPALAVMVVVMLVTGEGVAVSWLWLPAVLVLMAAFALGGALTTARLGDALADVRRLLPFVFRLLFYLSGVLYDIRRFVGGDTLSWIEVAFLANPFYVYLSLVRESLMSSHTHTHPGLLWLSGGVWALVALILGLRYFLGAEHRYGRG